MSALRSISLVSSIHRTDPKPGTGNPLIRKLQGLADLTSADIAALEEISSNACILGPHVDLIRDDTVPEDALVVLEGVACRYKQRLTGQRQILAYLLPGDFCDVEAPDLSRTDHAVGTVSVCLVARIPRRALTALTTRHSNIAQALHLAKLIEEATAREWLMNLGCRSATERMAHLFCELKARLEAVGLVQDDSCPLPLTQSDLGDTLGLSNVHVNRVLQELRHQGLVEFKSKRLKLLKPQDVQDMAEFNPAYLRSGDRVNGHAVF